MKKHISLGVAAMLALLTMVSPASATHAGSVLVSNSFAGTCGGTPYDGAGAPTAGLCDFMTDVIWTTVGPHLDDCNGATGAGCGQGAYLPGFGPPVQPAAALDSDTVTTACPTASSNNQWNPACWTGGSFHQVADSSAHDRAICLFASGDGAGGDCRTEVRGSFYRPLSGFGGYSGGSEGCGRSRTTNKANGDWTVADIYWIQSAGLTLPIFGRIRQVFQGGSLRGGHTGTMVFSVTQARSIAPGEPPGAGNAGLLDPGDSGTKRFAVTGAVVTLPGNGVTTIGPGAGMRTWCPDLAG